MFDRLDPTTPGATAGALAMSCVDAAHTAAKVAAGMPVDSLDGPQLRELTLQVEQLRRVLDATEHHALAELDRRRHTDLRRGSATSKWLAHHAQLPAGMARARLVAGPAPRPTTRPSHRWPTRSTPAASAATTRGCFAGAINERNAAALAPVLDDLIEAAQAMVFDVWKRHVEHLASMADPDGSHDPDADLLGNTLTLSPSSDFLLLRGELVGEHAICVADVLDAVADDLFQQFSRDAAASGGALSVPPRSTLMALALEEVCRRAMATDTSSTTKPRVEASLVIHATRNGDHLDIWAVHHHLLGPIPVDRVPSFLCDATLLLGGARFAGPPDRPGPRPSAPHPGPTSGAGRPRRVLHLPRLRRPPRLARRPPRAPLDRWRSDRAAQSRARLPSPPPGRPPTRLVAHAVRRWLDPMDRTRRSLVLGPATPSPASRLTGRPCQPARRRARSTTSSTWCDDAAPAGRGRASCTSIVQSRVAGERRRDVVDPHVGVGVERSAVLLGVDRPAHRRQVVADHQQRAAGCDGVEQVVDRHGRRACAGSTRSAPTPGRRRRHRTRRARWRRRGWHSMCSPRRPASAATRSSARCEMSFAVTSQPCSASQTASPPSPAPTSRARAGVHAGRSRGRACRSGCRSTSGRRRSGGPSRPRWPTAGPLPRCPRGPG